MFLSLINGPTKGDLAAWSLAYFHGTKVLISGIVSSSLYPYNLLNRIKMRKHKSQNEKIRALRNPIKD